MSDGKHHRFSPPPLTLDRDRRHRRTSSTLLATDTEAMADLTSSKAADGQLPLHFSHFLSLVSISR
jgi:hypothetical protein